MLLLPVRSDTRKTRPGVMSRDSKTQLSPIRKKQRSLSKQECPILRVNQSIAERNYYLPDAIHMVELESSLKLSNVVDHARELVCKNLGKCASWRRRGMNTVMLLVQRYGAKDETAAHALALLDRFLAANIELISHDQKTVTIPAGGIRDKADCYAIACYLIATKFKDVCSPCIDDLMRIVRPNWPKEHILQCEERVLSSIDWDLHVTTGVASRLPSTPCHAF
jgi:hypothetical protein